MGLVVAAGLLLRFWTRSGLWLDEALTVDIARLPLHEIPNALKHDGAPPLYYYLLHFWIALFGQSDQAVRSLSGLIAVLTLPVALVVRQASRGPGRGVDDARAAGQRALRRLLRDRVPHVRAGHPPHRVRLPRPAAGGDARLGPAICSRWSSSTAALLYAQYWSLYLVGMVVIWLLVSIVRTRRHGRPEGAPWAALIAVAVGCLLFVPWLPTFFFQTKHTGTPWAAPPNFSAVINALTGFTDNQGSTLQTATNQGRLLAVIYFCMLALAVFGVGVSGRIIELDLRTRPRARGLGFAVLGTLFAAIAGGIITASAFSSRYAAVVFLPFLLLVALGTTTC